MRSSHPRRSVLPKPLSAKAISIQPIGARPKPASAATTMARLDTAANTANSTVRRLRGAVLRASSTSTSAAKAVSAACTICASPTGASWRRSPNSTDPFQNTKLQAM